MPADRGLRESCLGRDLRYTLATLRKGIEDPAGARVLQEGKPRPEASGDAYWETLDGAALALELDKSSFV